MSTFWAMSIAHSRGGTNRTKINFLMFPKWILLWFQYIRPGKKEFLDLVHVLTLHISPEVLHFWLKIALEIVTGRKWRNWSKWSKLEFYLLRWTIQPPDKPQTPPRHLPDTSQTPSRHPIDTPKNGIFGQFVRNQHKGPIMRWKGPNGPETLLKCITHNYKSYWHALGPLRYPGGPKMAIFGLKQRLTGRN